MEQHKLRDELQKRSLVPSKNSWEQLSKKLTEQETVQKRNKWGFLKYVAIIIVLISVGLYFFKSKKQTVEAPVIAAPTIKKEFKNIEKTKLEPEIRVAETPVKKEVVIPQPIQKNKPTNYPKTSTTKTEFTALTKIENEILISEEIDKKLEQVEIKTEEILVVEQPSEEEILNTEVDQLLKNSTIKLRVNRQLLAKRTVSAQALLTEVEDDLDKDFKEKLVETIVNTLKAPRKVIITDRGN
ncbi:hypothetical protein SAMN06265371_102187 [Lutibacter agarilyticus]|uniref:Uncharacterized protein n=1 Tax=Lutibacter agarilyticus TaxID=1109740 RepID=A0A238VWX2_9FLAO|nr:hypothetical protein [Lutibacter agarilyticus]SNR38681.1 hypothetical protein SAMN06265371_102187 [Lutibacter agarilyticus]